MSDYHQDEVAQAFDVFRELLLKGYLDQEEDYQLYKAYRDNPGIEDLVNDVFVPGIDCAVVKGQTAYYLIPGLNNDFVGMKNAELRAAMGLDNNTQLYLCLFIMLCVTGYFYTGEGSEARAASYLPLEQLEDYITGKLERVAAPQGDKEEETIAAIEEECEYRIRDIAEEWLRLPPYDESLSQPMRSKLNRYSLIVRVGRFLQDHGLCHLVDDREFHPTGKLDAIVTQFYPQPRNRKLLLELLEQLGGNQDAGT